MDRTTRGVNRIAAVLAAAAVLSAGSPARAQDNGERDDSARHLLQLESQQQQIAAERERIGARRDQIAREMKELEQQSDQLAAEQKRIERQRAELSGNVEREREFDRREGNPQAELFEAINALRAEVRELRNEVRELREHVVPRTGDVRNPLGALLGRGPAREQREALARERSAKQEAIEQQQEALKRKFRERTQEQNVPDEFRKRDEQPKRIIEDRFEPEDRPMTIQEAEAARFKAAKKAEGTRAAAEIKRAQAESDRAAAQLETTIRILEQERKEIERQKQEFERRDREAADDPSP